MLCLIVEILGALWLITQVIRICLKFRWLIISDKDIRMKYGHDSWAVVTGATDGIGKEFVKQLSLQGVNVVIIARNKSKAENMISEFKSELNVKNKFNLVIADLGKVETNPKIFQEIYEQIKDLDIGLLINNVGILKKARFINLSEQELCEAIYTNCYAQVFLTKKLLCKLEGRQQKCGIINVSSVCGKIALPFHSIYCATKIFNDYFSRALSEEYKKKMDILSLQPFYVETSMIQDVRNPFGVVSTSYCVQATFKQIGLVDQTYGHWKHQIIGLILEYIPIELMNLLLKSKLLLQKKKKKDD